MRWWRVALAPIAAIVLAPCSGDTAVERAGTGPGGGTLVAGTGSDAEDAVGTGAGGAGISWTGTIELELSKDYLAEQAGLDPQVCDGSWRVDVAFVVAPDGMIAGDATASLTSGPDCTFEIPGSGQTATFTLTGTQADDAVELAFTQTSIEPPGDFVGMQGAMTVPFAVPLTSATTVTASVPISTTEAGPFPVTGEALIELKQV